jgi:nucleoside-diphosphate-sugar epimerase
MKCVYSKDAARGTVLALEAADLGGRVFNISSMNHEMSRCRMNCRVAEASRAQDVPPLRRVPSLL